MKTGRVRFRVKDASIIFTLIMGVGTWISNRSTTAETVWEE